MPETSSDIGLSRHQSSTILNPCDAIEPSAPRLPCTTLTLSTGNAKQQQASSDSSVGRRVDSFVSLSRPGDTKKVRSHDRDTGPYNSDAHLTFNLLMDGRIFKKKLDFATFDRWASMEVMLKGFEDDDIVIEQLWDVQENMPIGSGDWDARLRPGSEIDAICEGQLLTTWEDDSSCSSEEYERHRPLETRVDSQQTEMKWWFARWKQSVERPMVGGGKRVHEPSSQGVLLGAILVVLVFATVLVFCAI